MVQDKHLITILSVYRNFGNLDHDLDLEGHSY